MFPSWGGDYGGLPPQAFGGPAPRKQHQAAAAAAPVGGLAGGGGGGSLFSSLQEQHLQQMQQLQMLHQKQLESVLHHNTTGTAGAYGGGATDGFSAPSWQSDASGHVDNVFGGGGGGGGQTFYNNQEEAQSARGPDQPRPPPPQPAGGKPNPPPPDAPSPGGPQGNDGPKSKETVPPAAALTHWSVVSLQEQQQYWYKQHLQNLQKLKHDGARQNQTGSEAPFPSHGQPAPPLPSEPPKSAPPPPPPKEKPPLPPPPPEDPETAKDPEEVARLQQLQAAAAQWQRVQQQRAGMQYQALMQQHEKLQQILEKYQQFIQQPANLQTMSSEMQLRHYETQQQQFTQMYQDWEHTFQLWYDQFQTYPHKDQLQDYELQWKQWQEQMNATNAHLQERVATLRTMVPYPSSQYSDVPGPNVPRPDVPRPDVPGPDVPGPDVPGPDVPRPDVPGPDVPGPDVPGPDVPGPDVPGPDVPGPDVPGPDVPGPYVPRPDVPRPNVSGPAQPRFVPPPRQSGPLTRFERPPGPPPRFERPPGPQQRPPAPNQHPSTPNLRPPAPNQRHPTPNQRLPTPNQHAPTPQQQPAHGPKTEATSTPPTNTLSKAPTKPGPTLPKNENYSTPDKVKQVDMADDSLDGTAGFFLPSDPIPQTSRGKDDGADAKKTPDTSNDKPNTTVPSPVAPKNTAPVPANLKPGGPMSNNSNGTQSAPKPPEGKPAPKPPVQPQPNSEPPKPPPTMGRGRGQPPPPSPQMRGRGRGQPPGRGGFNNFQPPEETNMSFDYAEQQNEDTGMQEEQDAKPHIAGYHTAPPPAPTPTVLPKTVDYGHGHEPGTTVERISYGERIVLRPDPLPADRAYEKEPLGSRDPYGRDPYYDRRPDPYPDRREYSREREPYRDKPPLDYERERFDRDRYPPRDDRPPFGAPPPRPSYREREPREDSAGRDREDPYARPSYDRPPYERTSLERSGPERYGHSSSPYRERRGYPEERGPGPAASLPPPPQPPPPRAEKKPETKNVDDLLKPPGRMSRPERIVIIMRGLPGSGKSHVAKLIRDKEVECGGAPPRVLVLDDYFMTEVEKVEKDPDTGRRVKNKVLEYEYEPEMEDTYRSSLLKTFKKTLDDGFFPFIIMDTINDRVKHFDQFWSAAKTKGFEVYVAEITADNQTCGKRNVHGRTLKDIAKMSSNWEPSPRHMVRLDVRSLLQDAAIEEVEMEDFNPDDEPKEMKREEEEEGDLGYIPKSKWEMDTSEAKLDKLDGIVCGGKRKRESMADMEDFLQLPDDYATRMSQPGKKRVRWADLEEQKEADRKRAIGFVVGQTDWERITDESGQLAQRALNRTKFF
ncbi:unnamed protein product [Merluccius merluccius]